MDEKTIILQSLSEHVIFHDDEFRIKWVNKAAADSVGLSADELIGRYCYEIWMDKDGPCPVCPVKEAIETGAPQQKEMTTPDGRTWIVYGHPVRDDSGKVTDVVEITYDITDRKRAEEALREERDRAQQYLDVAGVMLLILDEKGSVSSMNRKGYEILGYEEGELAGKDWFDTCLPKKGRDGVRDVYRMLMEGALEPAEYYENPVLTKSGEERILSWHNTVLRDGEGNITGTLSSGDDITERKRMEDELRGSERRYRLLADNVSDVIWTMDLEMNLTYVSPSHERLVGFSEQEAKKRPVEERVTPESMERAFKVMGEELEAERNGRAVTSRSRRLEMEMYCKDGTTKWVEIDISFLRDDDNNPVEVIGVTRDITERKEAGKQRKALGAQLIQSQKMEAVGTLAGGVAHDFNNLLTAILGYTEMLLEDFDPDDPRHEDLREIKNAGDRAASLTSQLLAFSRRQPIAPRTLDLKDLISDLKGLLHRLIGEDIEFVTAIEEDVSVKADPGQIEQVLMNLVVNARDAMPGGGRLTVKTEVVAVDDSWYETMPYARAGRFVCLSVQDTGDGIDDEAARHIFEPFFTTKEAGTGTGLGLAVVYGIVKQHNGWIHVSSEPGRGSTFQVYLEALSEEPEAEGTKGFLNEAVQGHSQGVLVVEDEDAVRQLAEKALRQNGYTVFTAGSFGEALKVFHEERANIELVFSDMVLPDGTGLKLLDQLLSENPDLKGILCSGYTDYKSQWPLVQQRGLPFIQKPYTLQDLFQAVRKALAQDPGPS